MALRKTISQDELRSKLPADQQNSGPVYQSSRGGHYAEPQKPVPGTPQTGDRS
ncbi:hypothetical protein ACIP4W_40535 [Streptomyces sp. NPDC088846]|uniref:hypothetical protein n=1 Tax=Streptomyces sp. NPDC088846 TaxID=3365908 RepID=UPI00380C588F